MGTTESAARTFGGRWRVERPLKTGQGVETYLGVDLTDGKRVVIKTADASVVTPATRHRLEHEATVLRTLRHVSLAPVVTFGREGDLFFLVMPFVPGVTLEDRLKRGRLPVREAVTVALRLLEALREAHDHGILHRDVKPANVVVDAAAPITEVTLIDFGLARSVRLDADLRDLPVGTARYMSPEQAGLLDRDVDARSDLYALGVVLFECLAGRPPFVGEGFGDVLRQHLSARPPEIRSLVQDVPRALDEVVQRLLRKDPRDRYQAAAAVHVDLTLIRDALDRGETDPPLVVGARDRRPTLTEPAFIGRAIELATLEGAFADAGQGRGGVVLVEADSGGGKTRLLDEFAQVASGRGAWILRGQGTDQAAQRPFQLLDGVVRQIVTRAKADPAFTAAFTDRLGAYRAAVTDAIPDLESVLGPGTPGGLGPEAYGEVRSLPALATLLDALGTAERPAVVLIDDCQWADELTLKLLWHWSREPSSGRNVLLVAAFRSEEVPPGHALRAVPAVQRIVLSPFGPDDIRRLVESMAGPVPSDAVAVVSRLAAGSPFMASAILRGLVETGALVVGPSGWAVEPLALADLQSSRQAAAFLSRRIELLPPTALRVLTVGAVLGKEFDLDFAAALAGVDAEAAAAAQEEARRRHLIWADAGGRRSAFVHDKIRETLLERLESQERCRLHAEAARGLERTAPERTYEISYHYDAAGESPLALPYALKAAEEARARHALEIAERQYLIAERGSGIADHATRRRVAEGLGDVLMLRGRYEAAGASLAIARELATDDTDRARISGKVGELAFKRGDVRAACTSIEDGLRLLGRYVPRSRIAFLLCALWEALVQTFHTLLPRVFLARRPLEGAEVELLAIRLYSRAAYAYWFHRGTVACGWAHLREMNLAERYPETLELAQAYSEHAPVASTVPMLKRGLDYGVRSYEIRRRKGDTWGQGQSLHFQATVLYAASRYRECIDRCRQAVAMLERTGDRWESNTANWHIAFSHYRLGDLRAAAETAQRVHQAGAEIGDHQAMGISLGAWAKATGGRVPKALVAAELARPSEDVHTGAEVLMAEALRLLAEGSHAEAVLTLEKADRFVRSKGFQAEYVAPVTPWLATALRTQAEAVPSWSPDERHALLLKAEKAARRARRMARKYRNNVPHALRESALVAAMLGRPERARAWIEESVAVARDQEARYELGLSQNVRGHLGQRFGWAASEESLAEALDLFRAVEAPEARVAAGGTPVETSEFTLSLADRFESVLDAGRRITSALSRDAVFAAVRDEAVTLLRCERVVVLKIVRGERGEHLETASGDIDADWSRTLARRALAEGRPAVFVEGASEDASESVVLSGVRSALAAPVFVRGVAVGCFYATHRRVTGLFTDTEVRLAEYLATLAGAALENAEGFTALQTAHEDLKELDRLKTQLLNTASHELNTPLTPLKLQIHLLKAANYGDLNEKQRKAVNILERNVDRLVLLVQDMLDVARLQSGRLAVHMEPLDLATVVSESTEAFHESAKQTGVELIVRVNAPLRVRADGKRLTQVLFNLLTNALKFTPPGGKVVVEAVANGPTASVAVRDTGVGMTTEQISRLFQPFSQVHDTMQRTRAGTGLGLYISKGIVELHGGRIWCESAGPSMGSTFAFTVPLDGAPPRLEPAETKRETGIAKRARELV